MVIITQLYCSSVVEVYIMLCSLCEPGQVIFQVFYFVSESLSRPFFSVVGFYLRCVCMDVFVCVCTSFTSHLNQ